MINTDNVAQISTSTTYDLSNYDTIHIKAKYSGSDTYSSISVSSTREISGVIKEVRIQNTGGEIVEHTLDVSNISSGFIIVSAYQTTMEVYEIYLAPKQRKYIIKDGVLQDGFSLSSTAYSRSGYDSTGYSTITYNDGYIRLYSRFGNSWQTSCTVFLDNNLSSVTSGTMLYVEAITSFTNFDSRYPSVGHVRFSQVSGKVNKYSVYASSNQIINSPDQKTIYSTQCTNTSKYFAFSEMQIESSSSVTATLTIDIYNAWFY